MGRVEVADGGLGVGVQGRRGYVMGGEGGVGVDECGRAVSGEIRWSRRQTRGAPGPLTGQRMISD